MRHLTPLLSALLAACGAGGTDNVRDTDDGGPGNADCDYPSGAVSPMALDQVITDYTWRNAVHSDGREARLDLHEAHCDSSADIDWSPFDVLLFVSIPAW